MSLALKSSKASVGAASGGAFMSRSQFRGDPGLFGFLGDALGTVTGIASKILPGPLGTAAGAVSGLLSGGSRSSQANAANAAARLRAVQQVATPPIRRAPTTLPRINPPFAGAPGAGFQLGPTRVGFMENQPNGAGTKLACPSGFHPNKSDYFLKDGTFVPKGSRCVKNRRRNPLNPRAASRAVSRLESAKKATRAIDRVSIKCKRCGRARCRC